MSRGIEFHLFQRLADNIVWLALGVSCALDRGCLVHPAAVVGIELTEGVGQAENVVLLELGILPGIGVSTWAWC